MLKPRQVFSKFYAIFLFDFKGKHIFSTNYFAIPGMKFDDNIPLTVAPVNLEDGQIFPV
jgi:hypothetical protein